jgi:SAM-dependent methyltransferase
MEGTAERQSALWGARPRDWAEIQEGQVRALYEAVLEETGVGSGTALLDVGCGAGMAAQMARKRGATVSGFDATEPLIEVARERVPDGDFRVGEMEQLPFDDDSFDVVVGFNSFQFAANPANALREAARVGKDGATIGVATWGRPEQCDLTSVLQSQSKLLPPPPPGAEGPFALSEPGRLEGFVEQAGLEPQKSEDVETVWRYPDLETILRGLTAAGPGTAAIRESGEERVRETLTAAVEPFRKNGGYELRNVFRYLIARAA